jgi:hypothetical protein
VSEQQELDYRRVASIMLPHAVAAEERVAKEGTRFVHYTSAKAALEILQSRCMWMRNATCMNDYNEMRHGLGCLIEAFKTDAGKSYHAALDACHEGLSAELDAKFTEAAPGLLGHTYLSCVSEHSDDEELYGRLSMWRAYGSSTGVALIFDNGPFLRPSNALPIYSSPVAYIDAEGFQAELQKIAQLMDAERDLLKKVPKDELLDIAFRSMIFAVVSSKHEGFREEREWRVVHLPSLWAATQERLPLDHVALGGVPQPIFKIPFVDYPEEGFYGASIPDLINRIIIGPTQYPIAIQTAFAQILGAAGVQNPLDRVHCSNVTLRA